MDSNKHSLNGSGVSLTLYLIIKLHSTRD